MSIDDFGMGYTSLRLLRKLQVHELKIDKAFVIGMTADRGGAEDTAIVRSTADLAHNLGLTVVAEGVENQWTLDLLSSFGCDQAQGYHIARPMPLGRVRQLARHVALARARELTAAPTSRARPAARRHPVARVAEARRQAEVLLVAERHACAHGLVDLGRDGVVVQAEGELLGHRAGQASPSPARPPRSCTPSPSSRTSARSRRARRSSR